MRRTSLAVLCLGLLLIAVAIRVLSSSGERTENGLERTESSAPPEVVPTELKAPVDAGTAGADLVFTPLEGRGPSDVATEDPSNDASPDETPRESIPPRLVGRVVDENGRPVRAVEVFATSNVPRDAWPLDAPLWTSRDQQIRVSVTDDYGAFRVEGLEAGPVRLSLRKKGRALEEVHHVPLASGGETDVGEIVLRRGGIVRGSVQLESGQPAPHAQLWFLRPEASQPHAAPRTGVPIARTNQRGTFVIEELELGPFELIIEADGAPLVSVKDTLTTLEPGLDLGRITLPEPEVITGSVRAVPPGRLPDLVVHALPTRAAEFLLRPDGSRGRSARELYGATSAPLRADGSFLLAGLQPDTQYSLRLLGAEDPLRIRDVWSEPAMVSSGTQDVTLSAHPSVRTTFDVVDRATGRQVTEFEHSWHGARSLPRDRTDYLRATTEAERAVLEVRATGYATYVGEPKPLVPTPLLSPPVVPLVSVETVAVLVRSKDGSRPIRGARVVIAMAGANEIEAERQEAITDEDGKAVLNAPNDAGAWVGAIASGFAPRVVPIAEAETIDLESGGSAAVRVLDSDGAPVRGAMVLRSDTDPNHRTVFGERKSGAVTDLGGTAHFEHLSPGRHRFAIAKETPRLSPPRRPSVLDALPIEAASPTDGPASEAETEALLPSEWGLVEVRSGQLASFTIGSDYRGDLSGRITERGIPLSGAVLELYPRSADFYRDRRDPVAWARTDETGHFDIVNVQADRYDLSIVHASRVQPSLHAVTVTPWTSPFRVDLEVTSVFGIVTDDVGNPISGATVHLPAAWKQTLREAPSDGTGDHNLIAWKERTLPPVSTTSGLDGRFRLRGIDRERPLIIGAYDGDGHAGSVSFPRVGNALLGTEIEVRLNAASTLSVSGFAGQFPELSNRALGVAWRFGEHFDAPTRLVHPHPSARHEFRGLTADWWILFQAHVDGWGELDQLRVLENALMSPVDETAIELFR